MLVSMLNLDMSASGPIFRLTLNTAKTKEIVFRRPKVKYFHMPPAIDSIEQVDCCKLLGVFFSIQS